MNIIDQARIVKRLRAKIPKMICPITCHDCCGPVPFTQWEWSQVKVKRKGEPFTSKCPYASFGCEIYKDRPIICRLYGTINYEIMECPHGFKSEKQLSESEGKNIRDEYRRCM